MFNIRYASIRQLDISNGEGVGVALFVQGCNFHCLNCFNKETWDFTGGKAWNEEVKTIFFSYINKPYITRISILGGEPLEEEGNNLFDVVNLCKEIKAKFPTKKIWVYTGMTWEEMLNEIQNKSKKGKLLLQLYNYIDILIEGRYIEALKDRTLAFRGSSNQRIINIPKTLSKGSLVLFYNN